MKKNFLLIAAAATMLTACVNTEDYRDLNIQQDSVNDGSIGFVPFSEKMTKAENSTALYTQQFYAHHNNFAVWAYKKRPNVNNPELVFGTFAENANTSTTGTEVTVANDNNAITYTYSPLRFWDKTATEYDFYAAAPATLGEGESWTFNPGNTIEAGYFTTTAQLTGVNLKNRAAVGPGTELSNTFKESGEIDRLIAAQSRLYNPTYATASPEPVHLNFIHILSKLNITVKKGGHLTDQVNSTDIYTVILKEFAVCNMPGKGDFDESTPATATSPGSNNRWLLTSYETENKYNKAQMVQYNALTNIPANQANSNAAGEYVVTGTANYILESLVIPQDIMYQRVALDGRAHELVAATTATPYQSYAEYEQAKHNDVNRLKEEQFNALIKDDNGNKVFKNFSEYIQASVNGVQENIPETAANDGDCFEKRVKEASEIVEKAQVDAYAAIVDKSANEGDASYPYFKIRYTINGEEFLAYYNLAAVFRGYDNDSHQSNGTAIDANEDKFAFNEGWQNTLNIIINPTAIEFTADVAEWADAYNPSPIYEVK